MNDLTPYSPPEPAYISTIDPTGGRLVAWAEAASAAHSLAKALCSTTFAPRVKGTNGQMVPISVGDATAQILMGDELGLSPLAALRSVYVVHGTPALYAKTMVALALSQGHSIWTEESSDAKVVVCGQRRGSTHVERSEWTIARAQKAGYTTNKKYATNPQEMLYSKAAGEVARKVAADTLAGIPYSVEDLELEESPTTTVTRESAKTSVRRRTKVADPEPEPEAAPVEPEPAAEEIPDVPAPDSVITDAQLTKVNILIREQGFTERPDALAYVSKVIDREVASTKDLTKAEAHQFIEAHEQS